MLATNSNYAKINSTGHTQKKLCVAIMQSVSVIL